MTRAENNSGVNFASMGVKGAVERLRAYNSQLRWGPWSYWDTESKGPRALPRFSAAAISLRCRQDRDAVLARLAKLSNDLATPSGLLVAFQNRENQIKELPLVYLGHAEDWLEPRQFSGAGSESAPRSELLLRHPREILASILGLRGLD
jgi:hypothetical protein